MSGIFFLLGSFRIETKIFLMKQTIFNLSKSTFLHTALMIPTTSPASSYVAFYVNSGHPVDFPNDDFFEGASFLSEYEENLDEIELSEYRLKANVVPTHYKIMLEPYFDETPPPETEYEPFTFDGHVEIEFHATEENVTQIEFHMHHLTNWKIEIFNDLGERVKRESPEYQNETQKMIIELLEPLKPNVNYILDISYTGELNDDMKGFYRSYYNQEGKKVWLASTQFQQTSARRAFPCFDEPRFKAVFELSIKRPLGYQLSIANTIINTIKPDDDSKVIEKFNPTPKMSSYLMAFVVQMFKGMRDNTGYGVWARPEAESQLKYSYDVGSKLLYNMGLWVKYPFNKVPEIKKLDMIAVPDFSAGAMENWGAMTYRETNLLWDEQDSSAINKQRIAAVLTHEIAHLWFGDLVTCEWWSETWLNEGFARYFQYHGTHLVENKWNLPWQFVVEQVQSVFQMDSLPGTWPMTNPEVYTPGQSSAMFGSISYNKGASIIRMMEHHMGSDKFQLAIQKYIEKFEYKTVVPKDLFDSLDQEVPNAKISEVFTPWTTQVGYPVVTVVERKENTITVNQKRFLLNEKDHDDKLVWSIPVTVANRPEHFEKTSTHAIMPNNHDNFTIQLPENASLKYYILNVQQVGYYRVNYDEENWEEIRKALFTQGHGGIHVLNRAQIVDDLMNFARNGLMTYDYAMNIVEYLSTENNYIPWLSGFNGLTHLSKRIALGSDYERFRTHILYLIATAYNRLGFNPRPDEDHIDTLLRTNLLTWACKHGHEECITQAKEEFSKMRLENHVINPNIRIPVYCTGIREGTEDDFTFLWNKYKTTNVAAEEINILTTLGCAKTQKLIDLLLDKVLSDEIRSQDKSSTFTNSYVNNHENVDLVYNYLTKNYKKWEEVMGSVGSALSSLADRFTTEEQVKKLEEFAKTPELGENNVKTITAAVASSRKNIEWDKSRIEELRTYFQLFDDRDNSASSVSFSISLLVLLSKFTRPKMRETFSTTMDTTTTLTGRKGYFVTRKNLIIFSGIVFFCLIATAIMMYNIKSCTTSCHNRIDDTNQLVHSSHQLFSSDGIIMAASTTHSTGSMQNNTIEDTESEEDVTEIQTTQPEPLPKSVNMRLPLNVIPKSYDIKLIPFLVEDNFTFLGEVTIEIDVVEECNNITLHSMDLIINEVNLYEVDDVNSTKKQSIQLKNKRFDIPNQFYIMETESELPKGTYQLRFKYQGELNDDLQGFYRSSYMVGEEKRWLATTQFQPTFCRSAFPSFDEPALKATFKLNIARPSHMVSLSNMPKINSVKLTGIENYMMDIYEESVPMSTYLVAFVICDFKSLTEGNVSVWARPEAIQSAAYALKIGVKLLEFLETFFNVSYPLPKTDMIALPDFSSGAMENFGLITYRETALLYEEGISACSNKQRVAIVVSHELGHQWFGNLVTPKWWTDLWLNEGFASYLEYLGVEAVEPDWKPIDQFVVNEVHTVFALDALANSHPISVKEVENPDEINDIFDRISYAKGAAILRMLASFLTDKVFRIGLSTYLQEMSFKNAEQDDLWQFLTDAARSNGIFDDTLSVKEIMDTWTLQTGYPVVTFERNYDNDSFTIKQDRFILRGSPNKKSIQYNETWWIPITYTTSNNPVFTESKPNTWMRRDKMLFMSDPRLKNDNWLIANLMETGYYRVNYDKRNWNLISNYLLDPNRFKEIATTNRAQLIDDALNLARAGYLDYRIALDVTKYLEHEDEYVPWKAAISALNFIDSMLIKSVDYSLFKEYYLHIITQIYNDVGFEDPKNSSMLTVYKRVEILTAACHLGLSECISNCIRQYYMWMHEANPDLNNPISPNLKNIVYCMAIKYGDQTEWDFAWQRYLRATVSSEKEMLLAGLGCSRETWILKRFLEWSLSTTRGIRKQDVFRVFGAVSNSVIGQPIAFDFIRQNWQRIKKYFGQPMSNLNNILKYSTKRLNNPYELNELKEFANLHMNETGRTLKLAIEQTEANIAWMDKNYQNIVTWLTEQFKQQKCKNLTLISSDLLEHPNACKIINSFEFQFVFLPSTPSFPSHTHTHFSYNIKSRKRVKPRHQQRPLDKRRRQTDRRAHHYVSSSSYKRASTKFVMINYNL
uniref:Aminopeptidase N n=2 Tax=Culicoides sonorensis TaxID=179676 RepID=A0A336KRZ8_CULSO